MTTEVLKHLMTASRPIAVRSLVSNTRPRGRTDISQILALFNMSIDFCSFATFNANFPTAKSFGDLASYAFGMIAVTSIQTFAAYFLFSSYYTSVALDQACEQLKISLQLPRYYARVPTKWSGPSSSGASVRCHSPGSGGRVSWDVGCAQEEEALDLGTMNMLKVFGDQSHDLRGLAPLDRFVEDEDDKPVGWGLRVLEGL
jgi:hypothetical protein